MRRLIGTIEIYRVFNNRLKEEKKKLNRNQQLHTLPPRIHCWLMHQVYIRRISFYKRLFAHNHSNEHSTLTFCLPEKLQLDPWNSPNYLFI